MTLKRLWQKLRTERPSRPQTDWTTNWTLRDLADLPSQHPRRDEH
jgi:hypothetical protein